MENISSRPLPTMLIYWRKKQNTINKTTEVMLQDSREVGLEVNTEKTKISLCLATKMQNKS